MKRHSVLSNGVDMYKIASLDRRNLYVGIKNIQGIGYEIYLNLVELSGNGRLYIMEHKKGHVNIGPVMIYLDGGSFRTISSTTPNKYMKAMREIGFGLCDGLDIDHIYN